MLSIFITILYITNICLGCNWFSAFTNDYDDIRFPLGVCMGSNSDVNEEYKSNKYECANNGTHDYVRWLQWYGSSSCNGNSKIKAEYYDSKHYDCSSDTYCPWVLIREYEVDSNCKKKSGEWSSIAYVIDDCVFGVAKTECTANSYSQIYYVPFVGQCKTVLTNATTIQGCQDDQESYIEICCNDAKCGAVQIKSFVAFVIGIIMLNIVSF